MSDNLASHRKEMSVFNGGVLIVILITLCCCYVRLIDGATLDPTEASILQDFATSYNLGRYLTTTEDPCSWNQPPRIKCDCNDKNYTVCHVTEIDFSSTSLQGPFPINLTKLPRVYSLSLYSNNLTGPLPPEIGNLWNLTSLHLDSNQFNGTIPFQIGYMKNLQELWLNENNLSGQIPDIFSNLTNLLEVRITGNPLLTGPIPSSLFSIPSLKAIYIGELSPGRAMPTSFTTPLVNLTVLYLRNCQLTGAIPGTINIFSNLSYLDLSFNNLSGAIPSELRNITTLKALYLGNNSLEGSLPEGLGALSSLTDVDVSYNRLSGNLPSWAAGNSANPPNLVSNNFNSTSAANYSQLIQTQLSLLSCKNQKAPCLLSNSGKFTAVAVHAGGEKYANYNSDTAPLNTTAIFVSPDMSWAVSRTGYMAGSNIIAGIQSTNTSKTPYNTARTSLGSLRYYGLNLENGNYTVVLSFAEIVYQDNAQDAFARRVFDIYLQGLLVLKDFNIRELVGNSFIGIEKTFVAQVTDGVLDIHLFYAGKGTCCKSGGSLSFGPLISAISAENMLIRSSSSTNIPLITGLIVAAVIFSLALCFLSRLIVLRRRNRTTLRQKDQLEMAKFRVPNLFSYPELKAATRSFHPDNKLGEGGYGALFKGVLPDQTEVAVKTLSQKSCQGKQEFLNEAALITAVQHRNLVKLKGCCLERDHRILVYEFMENKSLHQTLFRSQDMIQLNWSTRFCIALGIARGLAYLHESEAHIIHCDIKSSNILLDKNFNPKIADFGLARLIQDFESHVSTRVAGTLGYVAPEYVLLGQLTEKADVFSFGVVLLELISERFNIRPDLPQDQTYLLEWAWNLKGDDDLLSLLDPNLKECDEDELWRMTHVAFLCTQAAAATRPPMSRVVTMMLGDIEIPATVSGPGFMSGLMGTPVTTDVFIKSRSMAGLSSTSTTNSGTGRGSEDESPFLSSSTSGQSHIPEEIRSEMLPR